MVITSRELATSRIVRLISSSVSESSDDVASSKTRAGADCEEVPARSIAAASLTRYFDAAFADNCVEALVSSRQQSIRRRPVQDIETLLVGRVRIHEFQVLANRSEKS